MIKRNGADIQVLDVHKTFNATGQAPTPVLRGVSLQVSAGEMLAITGPSGSGKTTLLQLIGALDIPDSGEIRINGKDLSKNDEQSRASFRNRDIGFVFQNHYLLPQLTTLENILLPTWATSGGTSDMLERADDLLKRIGLWERRSHFPSQLSGGESQRVAVARALMMHPSLILADEPTGALDHSTAQQLIDLLIELNHQEGSTLVLVTHARECAARMGRQVELRDGSLHQV